MTISLASKSSSGLPRLGVDLTAPSDNAPYTYITGIDATAGLTEVFNYTGAFYLNGLYLETHSAELMTVKLVIDGETIWNDTYTSAQTNTILLGSRSTTDTGDKGYLVKSSIAFYLQTATDTDVNLQIHLRKAQ